MVDGPPQCGPVCLREAAFQETVDLQGRGCGSLRVLKHFQRSLRFHAAKADTVQTAVGDELFKFGFPVRTIGQIPNEVREVGEARLSERFVDGPYACARLVLELEHVHVDVGAGQHGEFRDANEDEIGACPNALLRTSR